MSNIFEKIADHKTPPTFKFFSRGKWQFSKGGKTIEVISPVDGSVLGKIQAVTREEIDQAIEDGRRGQKEWENLLQKEMS